jgi:hypothetical protein
MKSLFLVLLTMFVQLKPPQAPKNDPTGVWQPADSSTKFDMKLNGSELKVHLVEGSNPRYLKYDVDLKNTGEVNSYEGTGSFVAKVKDKECKFETQWKIVVVQAELIAGYMSKIVPDAETCEVVDRGVDLVQLKKVK